MRCHTTQTGTWEKLGGCVGDGFHESLQLISDVKGIFWVVILLGADANGSDVNASLNLLKNKRVSFSYLAC